MDWKWRTIVSFALLLVLTGCWDRAELPEKGFVMGLAVDLTEDGKYLLTMQIFKPTQAVGGKGNEMSYVNITAEDYSISKAIREVPGHLGRKAQWSHLRVMIIGEELAKTKGLPKMLEFFYRDHEPRIISPIMITKGKAADYLRMKPWIENTISQQLFEGQRSSADQSAKTLDMNLLLLGKQTKSEVGNSLVPYVFKSTIGHMAIMNIEGAALLKKGKMVGLLDGDRMEGLQMLMNHYKSGMLQIPCRNGGNDKTVDTVEVISFHSAMQPNLGQRPPVFRYKIRILTVASELACTDKTETVEQEKAFTDKVGQAVTRKLEETIEHLKSSKFDALGLGNAVYRKNPSLWKQWKPEWNDIFAAASFEFNVEVKLQSSGTNVGKTALPKK